MFGNNNQYSSAVNFGDQPEGNNTLSFISLPASDNNQRQNWRANNNGRRAFGLNQRYQQRMVMISEEEEEDDDAITTTNGVGRRNRTQVQQPQPVAMMPSEGTSMREEDEENELGQQLVGMAKQQLAAVPQEQPHQQEMRMNMKREFFRHHHPAGGHAGLSIRLPWGNAEEKRKEIELFKAGLQPDYNSTNALKALRRFVQRGLVDQHSFQVFRTFDTPSALSGPIGHQLAHTVYRSVLLVSVQDLGWYEKTFTAISRVPELARSECAFKLILKLLEFGLITESVIELYCPNRKALLDPTRLLDRTMKAWLDADSEIFLAKMDEIKRNPENFEDFIDESQPNEPQQVEEELEDENQADMAPSLTISNQWPLVQVQEPPRWQHVQVVEGGPEVEGVHHQSNQQNIDNGDLIMLDSGGFRESSGVGQGFQQPNDCLIMMDVGENSGGFCESGGGGQGWKQKQPTAADANGNWKMGEERTKNPTTGKIDQMMEEQLNKFQQYKQWNIFCNRWAGDAETGGCSSSKMALDSAKLQEEEPDLLHF